MAGGRNCLNPPQRFKYRVRDIAQENLAGHLQFTQECPATKALYGLASWYFLALLEGFTISKKPTSTHFLQSAVFVRD